MKDNTGPVRSPPVGRTILLPGRGKYGTPEGGMTRENAFPAAAGNARPRRRGVRRWRGPRAGGVRTVRVPLSSFPMSLSMLLLLGAWICTAVRWMHEKTRFLAASAGGPEKPCKTTERSTPGGARPLRVFVRLAVEFLRFPAIDGIRKRCVCSDVPRRVPFARHPMRGASCHSGRASASAKNGPRTGAGGPREGHAGGVRPSSVYPMRGEGI